MAQVVETTSMAAGAPPTVPAHATTGVAVLATVLLLFGTQIPIKSLPAASHDGVDSLNGGALFWAALGFCLPIATFALAGAVFDQSFWGFLGCFRNVPMTTCEKEAPKAFLKRWRNAHSSNAQISAGCYVLWFVVNSPGSLRAASASTFLGVSLVIMGIVSYVWWGSRREIMWRLDHTFMEAMTLGLAILFLSVGHPQHEITLVAAAVAITTLRGVTHNGSALGAYGVVAYGCGVHAMRMQQGTGHAQVFMAALGVTLYGFVFKIADVAKISHWGTSLFHLFAAVGFALFFIWAETLPLSR